MAYQDNVNIIKLNGLFPSVNQQFFSIHYTRRTFQRIFGDWPLLGQPVKQFWQQDCENQDTEPKEDDSQLALYSIISKTKQALI